MNLPRLYVITDEKVVPNPVLIKQVKIVLEAGVKLLQVRFKHTPAEEQIRIGQELRAITTDYGCLFFVNDNPQLAKTLRADGVHLGREDCQVSTARDIVSSDTIIGVSGYETQESITTVDPNEVSYIGLLSPYQSTTKEKTILSESQFAHLVSISKLPVYAIGGVTADNTRYLMRQGCYGVAVISAIFASEKPEESVKKIQAEIDLALSS